MPGNIDAVTSHGCNLLIRDGAIPLVEVDDLLTDLGLDRSGLLLETIQENLGADEKRILEALGARGECTVDDLSGEVGLPAARINGMVSVLEMKGLVATALGKVFLVAN